MVVVEASSFFGEVAVKDAGEVAAVADTAIVEVFDLHVKVLLGLVCCCFGFGCGLVVSVCYAVSTVVWYGLVRWCCWC